MTVEDELRRLCRRLVDSAEEDEIEELTETLRELLRRWQAERNPPTVH
jgi:hypothetical protein